MGASFEPARFGSGQAVHRIEDAALLAGRGRFTDDVAATATTYLAFLRSPYAHARITSIDVTAALAVPGVIAVYTGADLLAAGVKPMGTSQGFKRIDGKAASPIRHVLATDTVRFVGEALVAVVAETRLAAKDGAEAVMVEFEDLPSVVDSVAAVTPGAAVLCEDAPDNVAAEMRHGDAAAAQAAFASAAFKVSVDVDNQRLAPVPMEPRSVLAYPDPETGRLTMRLSSQMPTANRGSLIECLPDLDVKDVRVLVGDVGGGFGMKTGAYPEDVVVAHAARVLQRPVRWQADRSEDFVSAVHGRDVVSHAEMALDANGKVLALRVRSLANVGAYAMGTGVAIQLLIGPWVSTSIYDIQTIDLHFKAVLTNAAPTGAYRGAGRPEAIFLTERLFDAAAREMKIDPAELRRRNMIRPEQMPYKNPMGQTYDSGRFEQILDQGLALADWNGFAARREASMAAGKLRGRGIATFLEWTGGNVFEERVTVNVRPDGFIDLVSATMAMGQGIATSYAQLAVDVFGVPIEKIRIVQGDTDQTNGFGSAGSRSLFTGGTSLHVAAERTVARGKELAADALEASPADIEYRNGRYQVMGTDLGIDLFDLAGKQADQRIYIDSTSAVGGPTWPNACHIAEVEIDRDTGKISVAAYASVNDIGRVVNPTIVGGQVDGGALQVIGQALYEEVVYDADGGQMLTGTFMDYAMPRADDVEVMFKTEFDTRIPCLTNALGVKGVGELGTIGATPAVVNAVIDALDHAGFGRRAEQVQMPITAAQAWRAMQGQFEPAPSF
ncbi:MAG: aldehyde oxidase and xanthine dehydrogenase molybdopterin binding [Rhizobacter sp.]|nr:aldehyde oxidase and xanthine dehydrogenase molybdopterin binding [Rhizobacter sp.]